MITLPFPPSSLSGHAKGHWRPKHAVTSKHREWALRATQSAGVKAPENGDIRVAVRFVPPDRRGDRVNFPNRMKPYFDGIAEALGVNDSRFVPEYSFADPEKPGRVEVSLSRAGDSFNLGGFARSLILSLIDREKGNPEEMKARIMIAWEAGIISAEEAEDWIVLGGLEAA